MDLAFLHKNTQLVLLKAISGSRAYGTDLPSSDTDYKGVFFMPRAQFFGFGGIEQISDKRNDEVYYELGRLMELLAKNNPNLIELLATPADCILQHHPIMDRVKPSIFLSKLCFQSFAGYAKAQIQKARGLNKKILNPMEKERKSILDFCYVTTGQASMKLNVWLHKRQFDQRKCGLVKIDHMRDLYALFYDEADQWHVRGIQHAQDANEVALSEVPKEAQHITYLYFNKDAYSMYCRAYREYWEWVEKRNTARYENTLQHGKNYDAKNMMHTFRLLDMAAEIGQTGQVIVRRPNRDELLAIRSGEFSYEELLEKATQKLAQIEQIYAKSSLPERPNALKIDKLLREMREELYA